MSNQGLHFSVFPKLFVSRPIHVDEFLKLKLDAKFFMSTLQAFWLLLCSLSIKWHKYIFYFVNDDRKDKSLKCLNAKDNR